MQASAEPGSPGTTGTRWAYWPEVDGLRTIAVLSVALFHLKRTLLPGGFVGVDIFFVISGFLISSILLDDIAKREFSIGRFYQRRISRIFPALILVILVTLAAAWFVYSAQDLASLAINAAAAATSLINMKLMSQGSYFILSADAQPLLHYWSLAVEEQFYIVFPLYLYAVMRFTRRALPITFALAVVSFVACVILTPGHQPLTFYALPTRAWELLVGSSLALYRFGGGRVTGRAAAGSVWVGLALLTVSVVLLREAYGFPGWIAALPVLGTAFLIAPIGDARPAPLRWLAHPAMVAVGKRSYSLYLWHWPVFSLVDYQLYASPEPVRIALKVGLTLIVTVLSYSYVERPARRYFNVRARRTFLFVATAIVVAGIAGGGVWLRAALYFDVLPSTVANGGTVVHGGPNGIVVLSGDSQAAMYGTEIASIARANGFTLYATGTAGRNQLPDGPNSSWPAVRAFVARTKPNLVILADAWAVQLQANPAALKTALKDVAGNSGQVLLLAEIPALPEGFGRDAVRAGASTVIYEAAQARSTREATTRVLRSYEGGNIHVLDVADVFTGPDSKLNVVGVDGRFTYFDTHHLSDTGAKMMHARFVAAIGHALGNRVPNRP